MTEHKTEDPGERIESALGRTEEFLHNHGRTLLIVLAVIVLAIGGYMAYKHLYMAKRAEKAAAAMYVAQQNFAQQLWDVALDGDGNNIGFPDIIAQYKGTPEANLAKHYAGVSYLMRGEQDKALDYLEGYKPVDGVPGVVINAQNYGLRGDIKADKGELEAAADLYAKAVKAGDDPYTTPMYLKKMGLALAAAGRTTEAVEAYQRILDYYPASTEARDIEKYIGATDASVFD
jgi:tetratricopeptide (TPR) repeat protein